EPTQRRALARRCVGSYGEHAAAPLTLAGWVAWSSGDDLEAREALSMALGADSGYLFARLLHQACNEGLDPESIRRCLRGERAERVDEEAVVPVASPADADGPSGDAPARSPRAPSRRRRRPRTTGTMGTTGTGSEASAADRPGSRPAGSGGTRRPRSVPSVAAATEGMSGVGDRASGTARSRDSRRPGTPKGGA
ncbi:DUF4192 family protein, partial [Streptomyces aurantiacus]|uniref:DUF4192 family protein n=1 Tax=Streptomyces aurantiacus TaxID=47760 RepID=UPI003CCBE68A